jgi:hypothetical protein
VRLPLQPLKETENKRDNIRKFRLIDVISSNDRLFRVITYSGSSSGLGEFWPYRIQKNNYDTKHQLAVKGSLDNPRNRGILGDQ